MRHVAEFVPRRTERDELDDSRSGEDASKCMTRLMADDAGRHEIGIRTPKAAIPIPAKPLACKPHRRRQREHAAEEYDDLEHRPLDCRKKVGHAASPADPGNGEHGHLRIIHEVQEPQLRTLQRFCEVQQPDLHPHDISTPAPQPDLHTGRV